MRCPKCGLFNPESAMWCDCGFDFSKGEINQADDQKASYLRGLNSERKLLQTIFISIPVLLLYVHGLGMITAFIIFSYQYVREHGFLNWLF